MHIETTDEGLEIVGGALDAAGIATVELVESHARAMEELSGSSLYWDYADENAVGADTPMVRAYLPDLPESRETLVRAKARVSALPGLDLGLDLGTLNVTVTMGEDADWENNWKKFYTPIEIGERLLVLPDWEPAPETERAILRLDPGVAFGTGAHHTTRMCLELLERTVHSGDSVLDLGCGSGILFIASRLLGAKRAVAIDVDPLAAKIAGENAEKNAICAGFTVLSGDVLADEAARAAIMQQGPYDVVAANIVADVIIRLAPFARDSVRRGGRFIASGVIEEREKEVKAALERSGFEVEETQESGGWVAFLCRG